VCGILAVLGGTLPVSRESADAALDLLEHRGPDDRGAASTAGGWLGARRLAILDTTHRGHQPLIGEHGVTVVFNGEIYNYVEVRAELRRRGATFRSGCDTEVLLNAYLEWGPDCLSRLNGMWGFCIFDPRDGSAFFARDRLGVKPLYLTYARERVTIASEAKSLLSLYPELRQVDDTTLYRFLARSQLHTDARTFYDGIEMIPPGHAGVLRPGERAPQIKPYWTVIARKDTSIADDDAVERFGVLFEDAVRIRMRSDVPVGLTLSGGMDSTAVTHAAAIASNGNAPIIAFTSVWDADAARQRDERPWARSVADRYNSIELVEVPAYTGDWLDTLGRVAWHLDAPNYSPAVVSVWAIMQQAQQRGVKVILEGQGADELLGGYVHHAALAFLDALRSRGGGARARVREARLYSAAFGRSAFASWVVREAFPSTRAPYRTMRGTSAAVRPDFAARVEGTSCLTVPPRAVTERLDRDLTAEVLPALLHYGDGVSMAHGVETRQPFLDYRLVELCSGLPDRWKVASGETKSVLRSYLRAHGHTKVAERRDKQGFPTPVWQLMAASDFAVARRLLLEPDSRLLAYCTRSGIEKIIAHAQGSRAASAHLYRLMSTEQWLRQCIS
jgi:asparagine synthase (glutamine-hydrolysing)